MKIRIPVAREGWPFIFLGLLFLVFEKVKWPKQFDEKHLEGIYYDSTFAKGSGLALIAGFCFFVFNLMSGFAVKNLGNHKSYVYMQVLVLIFMLLAFLTRSPKELVVIPKKKQIQWWGLSVAMIALGGVTYYFAMKYLLVSNVAQVMALTPVVTLFGGYFFAEEKLKLWQYFGVLLVVGGLVLLGV